MPWSIEYSEKAVAQLGRLDKKTADRIIKYMSGRVLQSGSPRAHGKALSGDLAGKWRYRVGKYRIICIIYDDRLTVLALDIDNRDSIYKR